MLCGIKTSVGKCGGIFGLYIYRFRPSTSHCMYITITSTSFIQNIKLLESDKLNLWTVVCCVHATWTVILCGKPSWIVRIDSNWAFDMCADPFILTYRLAISGKASVHPHSTYFLPFDPLRLTSGESIFLSDIQSQSLMIELFIPTDQKNYYEFEHSI